MATFRGAIFDVDGVLVDSPHEKAWREALRELMENDWSGLRDRTTWTPDAFTPLFYQQHVSGKPRMSGARSALEHLGVPDLDSRAEAYAQRKQDMIERLLDAGDFTAYPDALRFIIEAKDAGLVVAAASSSKNAAQFLGRIELGTFARAQGISSPSVLPDMSLLDLFDVDVSGRDFARGKPAPDMFLTAAHELEVDTSQAVVLEDAAAGVQAAKAGGMAAIGIARADDAALLVSAGADIVVTTLDDVDRPALMQGRLRSSDAAAQLPSQGRPSSADITP